MRKLAPCLWFDNQASEAADFYVTAFGNGKVESITHYQEGAPMPKGSVMTARFTVCGQEFYALNGGPYFTFTPAISFFVDCETEEEVDKLWLTLSDGGSILMELGSYPFGAKFGWLNDKYGVSWQIMFSGNKKKITPFFMFVGDQHGRAKEAIDFYCGMFDGKIQFVENYAKGESKLEGTVKQAAFTLSGHEFRAMDGGEHQFTFNEAVSFYIYCKDQAEIDYLWDKLTTDGGQESQCGWVKDKFGVSWQIVTYDFEEMINDKHPEKTQRVMNEMFKMKKINIQVLRDAFN